MNNKNKIYIYLILLPIIDAITGLTEKLLPSIPSIGLIVKSIFLIYMIYKLLFTTSKYKKISLIYLLIIFLYIISSLLLKIKYLNISSLFVEIKYILKILYFPALFITFLCYYDEYKFDKLEIYKILKIVLIEYSILLLIPLITNTSFSSYTDDIAGIGGKCGWFYSANEISIILILLFPFIYDNIENKTKLYIIIPIILTFLITSLGTKSSIMGLLVESVIMLIISIFKRNKKRIIYCLIIFISILFCFKFSTAISNFKIGINVQQEQNIKEKLEKSKEEGLTLEEFEKKYPDDALTKFISKYGKTILSDRDFYFKLVYKIYKNEFNTKTLLYGIGYSNTNKTEYVNITKFVEIDILDIFFHSGIIALLIVLTPFIYYLIMLIKNSKLTSNKVFYTLIITMIFGISCISGHTLMAPAVSIYLVLYFILALNELNLINKKKTNIEKNKITIYALHLNYGGVEKNICMKANMLCNDYNVEIISLYKLKDKPDFYINDKVKIKYLTNNIKPNKDKIKYNIKHFKIISLIKELIYSIKVLYLKNTLITKSMINCNSEYIISTRIDFTEKLIKNNEYKNIKIAEEHIYHNDNKKYLNRLNNILKYVDYLMPSSEYLTNYYKNIFNNNEKIITNKMPIETNNKISDINKKNIISVGRLEKEKGFEELIEIFTKINNKEWTLNIVGDGSLYNKLNSIIEKNNMKDNIKLLGFKNTNELNELYTNSSIYVMTSIEESFGLVLLEAASHGVPLIAYDRALGAKEIIDNSGILIKDSNKSEMIKTIKYLMNNIDERKYYQSKSLRLYNKYNYDSILNYNKELYKNMERKELYRNLYTDTKENCYKLIDDALKNKNKKFIITANSETYMLSKKDNELYNILYNKDNLIVPDGIFIVKTARYLNKNIKERISGVDIASHLLEVANKNKYKVYLFGATKKVMDKLTKKIEKDYPNIKIVGSTNGYVKNKDIVMDYIKETNADIIMIALGIPSQEKLINKHIGEFKKGIFIGVGGSFDVLSGSKKRAPKIFIKLNLEWLYRILKEPKRISRFIKYNLKYIIIIIKEKIYK